MADEASRLDGLADELTASVAMLLESQRERAALVLLFSTIDILGALDTSDGYASKDSFLRWADAYLQPAATLRCTATELYAARCGIVHALKASSSLSSKGAAREIAWLSSGSSTLPRDTHDPNLCVLHVGMLWQALRAGVQNFVADVKADVPRLAAVDANLTRVYVTYRSV